MCDEGLTPKVSIILLTACRSSFVSLAFRQIEAQEYPMAAIEVILVDDGEVPLVLADDATAVVNTTLVRLNSRVSIGAKRNTAVQMATGSVIVTWDGACERFVSG